jgi:hypothetical protein
MDVKLFGIGLNKTGTTTLGECARILGYRHVACRRDLLIRLRQGSLEELLAVADAHDAFEDWPWPLVYKELFRRYGDRARYVLTVRRTPEAWLRSLKNHALLTLPEEHCRLLAYGYAYPHGFEAEHLAIYARHNAEVVAFFASEGASHLLATLCWEEGHGWAELCRLLGRSVPDVPFPHANRTRKEALVDQPLYAANAARIKEQLRLLGLPASGSLVA